MTRKRKAILFFTGFAIPIVAYLWFWHDKHDVQYEVVYPPLDSLSIDRAACILSKPGEIIGPFPDDPELALFIWHSSEGTTKINRPDFESPQEFGEWVPVDVNVHGHIVGFYETGQEAQAFLWTPEKGFILLGDLGGGWSNAWAINEKGMVVGLAKTIDDKIHAYLWEEGRGMMDIAPDAQQCYAYAINNLGQVAGQLYTADHVRAFLWDTSIGMQTLDLDMPSAAYAINDSSQLVGCFTHPKGSKGIFIGDTRNETRFVKFDDCLPILNNHGSIALTIFSDGSFIGKHVLFRPKYEPYIGSVEGEFVSLYTMLPKEKGLEDINIRDMNDRGDILVTDTYGQLALLRPIQKQE
ncbi:MAG: hypothetical protein JXA82_03085 [Sedimentisphaerales bacterium]|nr:hypothetical protein [Sedimentisphaerales bacterium]